MIKISFAKNDMGIILTAIGKLKTDLNASFPLLTREAAEELVNKLRENIVTQVFGDFGEEHNKKWAAHKASVSKHPGEYWIYTGLLMKQINFRQIGKGRYWVGIDRVPGDNNPAEYGPILEEKRPLFHNTVEDYMPTWNSRVVGLFRKMKQDWK